MQTEHFFTFIDLRIPLVIQGLENCLALRFDKGRRGACLFTLFTTVCYQSESSSVAM